MIELYMLIVTIVNVFLFTALGLYISTRFQLTSLFNELYTLYGKLQTFKKEVSQRKDNSCDDEIANLQLQMKHIVWEIQRLTGYMFCRLSFSQDRMMAECCELFLYYNDAKKYWNKCFSSHFNSREIESEYHCRCGQFFYSVSDLFTGNSHFEKALDLPYDSDNRKYINLSTYLKWNESMIEAMNNCQHYQLFQNKKIFEEFLTDNSTKATEICMDITNRMLKKNAQDAIESQKHRLGSWIHKK